MYVTNCYSNNRLQKLMFEPNIRELRILFSSHRRQFPSRFLLLFIINIGSWYDQNCWSFSLGQCCCWRNLPHEACWSRTQGKVYMKLKIMHVPVEWDWCSFKSTCLTPMCPLFDSQTLHHKWTEFVGSLLGSERF